MSEGMVLADDINQYWFPTPPTAYRMEFSCRGIINTLEGFRVFYQGKADGYTLYLCQDFENLRSPADIPPFYIEKAHWSLCEAFEHPETQVNE